MHSLPLLRTTFENCKDFYRLLTDYWHSGGVSMFLGRRFRGEIVEHLSVVDSYIKMVFFDFVLNSEKVIISSVYKPPTGDRSLFLKKLEENSLLASRKIYGGSLVVKLLPLLDIIIELFTQIDVDPSFVTFFLLIETTASELITLNIVDYPFMIFFTKLSLVEVIAFKSITLTGAVHYLSLPYLSILYYVCLYCLFAYRSLLTKWCL